MAKSGTVTGPFWAQKIKNRRKNRKNDFETNSFGGVTTITLLKALTNGIVIFFQKIFFLFKFFGQNLGPGLIWPEMSPKHEKSASKSQQ